MQRGVHLPASGKSWKDKVEAAVGHPPSPHAAPALPTGALLWAGVLHRSRVLAQRICCWIVSNARCHTEAPLHQEATAEEIPPSEEAAPGKGRSAWAGSRRTIVTLVGCRVLPWLALIGSNCIFKAVWVPSPSVRGLIDCRECVCGRGLLKAPREHLSSQKPSA